jgi:hypothetical protein
MKTKHIVSLAAGLGLLLAVLAFGAGCGDKAKSYTIELEADASLAQKSVLVDVIGATPYDAPVWEAVDIDQYWQPGSAKRAGAEKVTKPFGPNHATTYRLGTGDVPWKEWMARGVNHLVVIADIPGLAGGPPGNANPRRKILPLSPKHWAKGTSSLKLRLQVDGIRVDTPVRQ